MNPRTGVQPAKRRSPPPVEESSREESSREESSTPETKHPLPMRLQVVEDRRTRREFRRLPKRLYRLDKRWIPPLEKDIEAVFDPARNPFFRHGHCQRWILTDACGRTIGRVAAFVDRKTAPTQPQPTGGMGFFECIEDSGAAGLLFDACRDWLKNQGMQAMDGPVNFGDRDRWWGLLVDGFTEPSYGMNYHLSYYRRLFEDYGFREYFRQFTFYRDIRNGEISARLKNRARAILTNPDFRFRHATKNRLDRYMEDFRTVYNQAWAGRSGVSELSREQARSILRKLKPVLDERLLWFAYHHDRPVAFFLGLPELNQIFKYLHGKWNPLSKMIFLYHKTRQHCTRVFGIVFGVAPEFQGCGIVGAIITTMQTFARQPGFPYRDIEMAWIGDFNPRMLRVVRSFGGTITKTHITYRYLFDPTRPAQRAPVLE